MTERAVPMEFNAMPPSGVAPSPTMPPPMMAPSMMAPSSAVTWKISISGLVIAVAVLIWLIVFTAMYARDPKFNSITVEKESKMDAVRYKRPVIDLDIANNGVSNPQTYTVDPEDTGAVFNVTSPSVNDPAYIYSIKLPAATGSGIYYTFVFGNDIVGDSSNNVKLDITPANGSTGKMIGTIEVSALPGSPLQGAGEVFPAPSNAYSVLFDNSQPVNSQDSTTGIRKGTELYVLDIDENLWYITGSIVIDSQVQSANDVVTPFRT